MPDLTATLLGEISPEAPSGPDLEYDAAFLALRKAAAGTPEVQVGDTVTPAVPPDWREVESLASGLLGRTHDIRVAVELVNARTARRGFAGLVEGLSLIRGMLELYWETVHPQLDAEDNNDPTRRMNALAQLASRTGLIRLVREVPLASSRVLGQVTLRELDVAKGLVPPREGAAALDEGAIAAIFADADAGTLRQRLSEIELALAELRSIDGFVVEKVGAVNSPQLGPVLEVADTARSVLAEQVARRGPEEGGETAGAGGAVEGATGRGGGGPIRGRQDVLRALDEICRWYEQNEPASPVPILCRRAKRLVTMSFMELLRDLAPEGIAQMEKIRGEGAED